MGRMLLRGLQVGLAGGLGFDFFFAWFCDWNVRADAMGEGLLVGLVFGVLLGVGLIVLLGLLRLVDRLTGWKLADRLQAAEPGPAGLIAGFLFTAPCMLLGGLGLGWAGWELVKNGAFGFGPGWAVYMALLTVPLGAVLGAVAGALAGTVAGNGLVGMLRGAGLLRKL